MIGELKKKYEKDEIFYLKVKARPGAQKTQIKAILEDENGQILKIDVGAPPIKNKANLELVDFISREFAVIKKNVKIISGTSSQIKLLKIIK